MIPTPGISLHFLDHQGHEPTIVLLPGLTANAHIFDGLIQAGLSPHFHVLALDLRGAARATRHPPASTRRRRRPTTPWPTTPLT